ncbi:MAG: glycosyltransferase family 4 protein [Vicinamibacteria bacterium]
MRVTLATEVFPPKAGGAGWSTRALALALHAAGHNVTVVTTAEGPSNEGPVPVIRLQGATGRFRRGAMVETFRDVLARKAAHEDVIHAQHSLSALGALTLEPRPRTVVTVRDHWPVCFWSTRMSQGKLCPECSTGGMWRCIEGRLPRLAAPGAIPYMKWDLADKQSALRRADAVIAVSEAIARELRAVSIPDVTVLPNIVDAVEVNAIGEETPAIALPDRFVLFVGKLEANKGAADLIPALVRSKAHLPLVILGSGSEKEMILAEAERNGIKVVTPGWTDRCDVIRAMKRAEALVFPSTWPEPLSRVLLEALALGMPIAAMDTGGTSELIQDGVSGLLARNVDDLGDALGRIVHDGSMRSRMAEGATVRARLFSPRVLIPRYEALYRGNA